jgi:CDP-glucose 4,6-dehydratase
MGDSTCEGVATLAEVLDRTWRDRRVLVTGHTGFVGAWLCSLLARAGAQVTGLALDPLPGSLAARIDLGDQLTDARGDVRDTALVAGVVERAEPEIVVHLAAQALVLPSFDDPLTTWTTNVIGTANLLEAMRRVGSARACVVVTSDKCYSLGEGPHPETDPLGGEDPYSASKACAELVAHAYSTSFWPGPSLGIATARAGNIIGGGDVALDRVLPDCARAAAAGEPVRLRHPRAVRPWQHVLDAVAGYVRLGDALLRDPVGCGGPWNFGPDPASSATVAEVVALFADCWSRRAGEALPAPELVPAPPGRPERAVLTLDSCKSNLGLGWSNVIDLRSAVDWSVEVYLAASRPGAVPTAVRDLLADQMARYVELEASLREDPGVLAGARSSVPQR